MNTLEMLKKSLAFTLGAASFSAEKVRQFTDEMVARGEMSTDDAKKFVDDVSQRAEEEKKSIQDWIRDQTVKMVQQVGAADLSRVERLEQRIASLEARLAGAHAGHAGVEQEGVCVVDPATGECIQSTEPETP